MTGYYSNRLSVFTNTQFKSTASYCSASRLFMPANQSHNLTAGTAVTVKGDGFNAATTYYIELGVTSDSFRLTTTNDGSGVTTDDDRPPGNILIGLSLIHI